MKLFKQSLPKPKSQVQEVFFILLKDAKGKPEEKRGVSRKEFMDIAFVLNAPGRICDLRNQGVVISRKLINRKNKFGRDITYSEYFIPRQFDELMESIYKAMVK